MRETECIGRLFKLADCYEDMVRFLVLEKLITEAQITELKMEFDKSSFLHEVIKTAEKNEKLVLVSFDWVLLPIERIRIRLISPRHSKEFTYRY